MSELHTLERPKGLPKHDAPSAFPGMNALGPLRLVFPAGAKSEGLRLARIEIPFSVRESLHYRATIELEEDAEARIALRFVNGTGDMSVPLSPTLLTTSLDIRLAARSRLRLYVVSELSVPYFRETSDRAVLQAGAKLEWTSVGLDETSGIHSTDIELDGTESELDFAGAYGAHGSTEQEHIISVHHRGPRTRSRTNLKSALRDSSHLIFRGLIRVDPSGHGTDAYFSDKNLLMEDGARAESLPQLKIDTDDVACSHGATTGGPREDALFYLMSRGLDRDAAKNILVLGHLGSVLGRLPESLVAETEDATALFLGIHEERRYP